MTDVHSTERSGEGVQAPLQSQSIEASLDIGPNIRPPISAEHRDRSDPKRWVRMSLRELQTYTPGRLCVAPAWWAIDGDCVLFFKGHSPQNNVNPEIAARICPDLPIMFIARAFVPPER